MSAVFEDHHEHDDVYYPKNMLKFMANNGQDVSGLKPIPGRIDMPDEIGAGKGLVNHSKWNVRDPTDNKIVVPFSFMSGYLVSNNFISSDFIAGNLIASHNVAGPDVILPCGWCW